MATPKKTASLAWLERSNPLSGLSISEAKSIFDAARSGNTQRLHWLYQEIEAQNPVLSMCVSRRSGAAAGFNWAVTERAAKNGALSGEQKDAVETFLADIDNFADLFEHLDLALFRGFAHAQPIWEGDAVHHIELLDSWKFLKQDGEWFFNPACDGYSKNCISCQNARLVTVERRRPVDVPALAIHIRSAVGERDWGRFLERYALPKPAIIMAPNATEKDRDKYLQSGEGVENGEVTVWPNGASISDFAGGSRGVDPFSVFITHQEKTILMLSTGGTLGSMAEAGSGTLAGNAQQDVWEQIVARDSGIIAAAVQRAMVRPFLARKFPGSPVCVDFAFDLTQKPTPKEVFETAAAARNAGYLVDQHELEEATGFTLVKDDAPAAPQPGGFALNSKQPSGGSGDSPRAVGQILARLARQILNGSVPFEDALKAAQKELDAASLDVLSGNLEKALTEAMFTAAASSLAGSAPAAPSAGSVKNVVDANGQDHDNLGRFGNGNGGAATTFTPATTAEVTKFKTELPKAISPEEFDAILTTGFDDTDGAGNKVKYGTLLRDHINEQGRNAEDLGARKRELGNIVRIVRETQPVPTARAGGKERIYAGHIGDKAYVAVADEHNEIGAFVMVSYRRDGKHDKK